MKTIIIKLILISAIFLNLGTGVYAETGTVATDTTIVVTEKMPWDTSCKSIGGDTPDTRKYECTVKGGFESVMDMIKWIIKYVTFIAVLIVVLMLVISGVRMSVEGNKDGAKKQFTRVIWSLIVIFTFAAILRVVAPWVYN